MRTCLEEEKSVNCNAGLERWCGIKGDVHSVTVHALAHEDVVVIVIGNDLLHGSGSVLLELLSALLVTLLAKGLVDFLDVA